MPAMFVRVCFISLHTDEKALAKKIVKLDLTLLFFNAYSMYVVCYGVFQVANFSHIPISFSMFLSLLSLDLILFMRR